MINRLSVTKMLFAGVALSALACYADQVNLTPANVIHDTGSYAGTFGAGNIFDNQGGGSGATINEPFATGYWINPDNGPAGAYILINLGAQFNLSSLELYNTHNGNFRDRGTGDFTFEASNTLNIGATDLTGATSILSGTLVASNGDPISGQSFSVSGTYQYLKFEPTSVAVGGTPCCGTNVYGLNELKVFDTASATPEPASFLLVGSVGSLLVFIRRRTAQNLG